MKKGIARIRNRLFGSNHVWQHFLIKTILIRLWKYNYFVFISTVTIQRPNVWLGYVILLTLRTADCFYVLTSWKCYKWPLCVVCVSVYARRCWSGIIQFEVTVRYTRHKGSLYVGWMAGVWHTDSSLKCYTDIFLVSKTIRLSMCVLSNALWTTT